MSGTNQTFPLADTPQLATLKSEVGKPIALVAKVEFEQTPPRLIVEGKAAQGGMEGTGGMAGMKGMPQ